MATNLMMTGMGDAGTALPVPVQIPNLLYWFDANKQTFQDTSFTTPAVANNDPVGGWKDQSGNGLDATQATGSKRPKLQTNQQNGLSTVLGDGLSQTVGFTQTAEFSDTTWFFVGKSVSFDGGFITAGFSDGGVPAMRFSDANNIQAWGVSGFSSILMTNPASTTNYQIFEFTVSHPNTMVNYLNGANNGSASYSSGVISHKTLFSRNASGFANFFIGEVGAYSRILTGTEITNLYNYLHTKWSI